MRRKRARTGAVLFKMDSKKSRPNTLAIDAASIIQIINLLCELILDSMASDEDIINFNSLLNNLHRLNPDKPLVYLLVEDLDPEAQALSRETLGHLLLLQANREQFGFDTHPVALNFSSVNDTGMTPLEFAFDSKNLDLLKVFADFNDATRSFDPSDFDARRRYAAIYNDPMINSRGQSIVDLTLDLLQRVTDEELEILRGSNTLSNLFIHYPPITESARAFRLHALSTEALQLLEKCFTDSEGQIKVKDDEAGLALIEYSEFAMIIKDVIRAKTTFKPAILEV